MLENIALIKGLTEQERLAFQTEFNIKRKEVTTGVLLCFFLGGVGAHKFYLGQTGLGILYACFFWTLIPGLAALVECFLMKKRIERHNESAGVEIVNKVKLLRSFTSSP